MMYPLVRELAGGGVPVTVTKGAEAIAEGIQDATAAGMVLIPVVDDLTTFDNQVPVGVAV